MKIRVDNVRLSFPHLFKAKQFEGSDDAKYSAVFLMDKAENKAEIKKVMAAIKKMIANDLNGAKVKSDKLCLRDGSTKDEIEGFGEDVMFVSCNSKRRPLVIDRDGSALAEDDGKPYAGCYVSGLFRLWAQNNKYGKRINAELLGVQFREDGEPFGGGEPGRVDDFDIEGGDETNEFDTGDEDFDDDMSF